MSDLQARFTHGRWQAARLAFPGRGGDGADAWVIDVVADEEADEDVGVVRGLARYRPRRGMTPDLGPVMERAIAQPIEGRPHLPLEVRVANAALADEIRQVRPEVMIIIDEVPVAEALAEELAEEILPDEEGEESWRWLAEGVSQAQVTRLFEAFAAAAAHLTSDLAPPLGQLIRVSVPSLGIEPAWALVTLDVGYHGNSVATVAIAPDAETREAWDADESTDDEITILTVEQDDLSPEAYAEIVAHGWRSSDGVYARVVGGGADPRAATPGEIDVACAVLEAMARSFDPFAATLASSAVRRVTLADGTAATVEMRADDVIDFGEDEDEEEGTEEPRFIAPGSEEEEDALFLREDKLRAWKPAPPPRHA